MSYKLASLVVISLLGCTWMLVSRSVTLSSVEAGSEDDTPPVDRSAECRWAGGDIKIDGLADEPAWKNAQVLDKFVAFWAKRKPKTSTKARLLWDDKYLYFTAEMEDTDLYADIKERNGMTWSNDVFELFFKPHADKLAYYEFQVNAANTPLELYFPSRGSGGYRRFAPLTHIGLQSAVVVKGTLNNWHDKDEGWVVEGRIPWADFSETGGAPKAGDVWRGAICRYDYSVGYEETELSSSAPVPGSFHAYEHYNKL